MRYSYLYFMLGTLILSLFISGIVSADPGEVDQNEGHYDQKTGKYHYHRQVTPPTEYSGSALHAQAISDAKIHAATDAKTDSIWYGAGFLFGVFGIGAAYVVTPSVPPMRMLGKTPEYVVFYTDAYQKAMKTERIEQATTGCIIWGGVLAGYYLYTTGRL